ncbi:VTT domain-containing protein [uncultured Shewanella sp.]|uniref:3-dehydroquinate synthase family protein n=1 Tax=uncultured Shewanella sp. TaxID=173975 RepID=UPI00262AC073|nr:VTT domain-containing protein [uncultured Shewanella sp.]
MLRSAHLCILLTTLTLMVILSFLFLEQSTTEVISTFFLQLQQERPQSYLSALFLILVLSVNVILPIPASLPSLFATEHFNHLLAPIIIWFGLTTSSLIGYWLGHHLKNITAIFNTSSPIAYQTKKSADHVSSIMLILFRAIPVLAEISVITAGILQLPIRQFIWLISLSNIGLSLAYNQLGSSASSSNAILFLIIAGTALPSIAVLIHSAFSLISSLFKQKNNHPANITRSRSSITGNKLTQSTVSSKSTHPIFTTTNVWSTHSSISSPLLAFLNTLYIQQKSNTFVCIIDQETTQRKPYLPIEIQKFFNFNIHLSLMCEPVITSINSTDKIEAIKSLFAENKLNRNTHFIVIGTEYFFQGISVTLNSLCSKVPIIFMPSTLSSQAYTSIIEDSSLQGGSKRDNSKYYCPPLAIFNDFKLLSSITQQTQQGLVFIVKMALLKDAQFFNWIEINADALRLSQPNEMQYAISRCTQLKQQHLSSSLHFYHQESTSQLEYGQWSHQLLSSKLNLPLEHAEIMAISLVLNAFYSSQIGLLNQEYAQRVVKLFDKLDIKLWHEELKGKLQNQLIANLKEKTYADLPVPLLTAIGYSKTIQGIESHIMEKAINTLYNDELTKKHVIPKQAIVA